MSTTTTRKAVVIGHTVTVHTTNGIDTVDHDLTCKHCGKKLRPNYDAEGGYVRDARPARMYEGHRVDDPEATPYETLAKWDADARKWMIGYSRRTWTARKWRGNFGSYGDNFFCGLNCARRWAIAKCKQLFK